MDKTRDQIAARVGDWDFHTEGALDLAAELYVAMRREMHAKSAALRGPRRPKYFREMLLAAHAVTVEDVARLVIQAPREMGPFVRCLVAAHEQSLAGQGAPAPSIGLHEAVARASERTAAATATVLRAADDGHIDAAEASAIDLRIADAERELTQLKAEKDAKLRAQAERLVPRAVGRR